ncbi:MAG: DUF4402 domain-containing protein [Bacteroidota bacterium]
MKNLTKCLALLMIGFSTNMFAQAGAIASAAVNIVAPISITKSVDMNFGIVATGMTEAGTAMLNTDGTRSTTGGVTIPPTSGSPTAASFVVTGTGNYTYEISLPSAPITLNGATEGVTVGSFVSSPNATGTLNAGTQTVYVGATLNVPESTVPGSYSNGSGLKVTVNYN